MAAVVDDALGVVADDLLDLAELAALEKAFDAGMTGIVAAAVVDGEEDAFFFGPFTRRWAGAASSAIGFSQRMALTEGQLMAASRCVAWSLSGLAILTISGFCSKNIWAGSA